MPKTLKPISKAGYRVQISDYSGFFTMFSGLDKERDSEKVPTGNSRVKVPVHGLITINDVDLAKPFEEGDSVLSNLISRSSREPLTITVQPVEDNVSETPIGQPIVLLGCVCIKSKIGETDRDTAEAGMVELTFSISSDKQN